MPTTIHIRPSISNTDTITSLRLTTPASDYCMVENPILYGGSTALQLDLSSSLSETSIFKAIPRLELANSKISCELYVLNSCFVIWFDHCAQGIQFDYHTLILHALTELPNGSMGIYFQIENQQINDESLDQTEEFSLSLASTDNGLSFAESNQLFKDLNLTNVIQQTFEALTECTSFHADPSSSEENNDPEMELPEAGLPNFSIIDNTIDIDNDDNEDNDVRLKFDDDNVADDLGQDEELYTDKEIDSGAIVDVGRGPVIGVVRNRDSTDETFNGKVRKVA